MNVDNIRVYCFNSIYKLEESHINYEVILLDIDMPDINGIEYARTHTEQNIVFVTGHGVYMKQAFGPNVYGFIEKTENQEDFQKQISDVIKRINMQKSIHVKVDNEYHKIYVKDIIYVQYIRRKTVCIKTKKADFVIYGYGIKEFSSKLEMNFIFIDRDTLCNVDYIMGIIQDKIILKDISHQLKISKRKISEVKKAYFQGVIL